MLDIFLIVLRAVFLIISAPKDEERIELWLPCEEFCSFLTCAAGFSLSLTILTEDLHTKLLKFESLQIVQMSSNIISRRNNQNEIAIENDKTISKTCVLKKYEVRINATALCMQAKQTLACI